MNQNPAKPPKLAIVCGTTFNLKFKVLAIGQLDAHCCQIEDLIIRLCSILYEDGSTKNTLEERALL